MMFIIVMMIRNNEISPKDGWEVKFGNEIFGDTIENRV